MPAIFFQQFWNIVGGDVVKTIQDIFIYGRILAALNRTTVVLISKTQSAFLFNQLRPISLCNIVYKIFAKILVSHIRPLLLKLISPNQAAFSRGRQIGENSILVNEIVRHLKNKKGDTGYIRIKFDLHKAYDRVNWAVLNEILIHYGFFRQGGLSMRFLYM